MPGNQGVTVATESDLDAMADMRLALGWHPNRWLLGALHRSELGRFFLQRGSGDGGHLSLGASNGILAMACAAAYGPRGFIGNVIVHESARRRGWGRQVMGEALAWLRAQGVDVVELDATPDGRPLYERLGFVGMHPSWFLRTHIGHAQRHALAHTSAAPRIETLSPDALGYIAQLDLQAFGGNRLALLSQVLVAGSSHLYAYMDENGSAVGYLMARPLDANDATLRVGPWVARTPQIAAALLHHAVVAHEASEWLPGGDQAMVLACVDGSNERAAWLARTCGLTLVEDDLRMRLTFAWSGADRASEEEKPAMFGQPEWVYAMAAPMVG